MKQTFCISLCYISFVCSFCKACAQKFIKTIIKLTKTIFKIWSEKKAIAIWTAIIGTLHVKTSKRTHDKECDKWEKNVMKLGKNVIKLGKIWWNEGKMWSIVRENVKKGEENVMKWVKILTLMVWVGNFLSPFLLNFLTGQRSIQVLFVC